MSTIRKSYRNVKINGEWHDEVAKEMIGTTVVAIQVRGGRWFLISEVEMRS